MPRVLTFDVPEEKCEVRDAPRLAAFRGKLTQWHDEMFGDDPSCVWRQIHTMLWNDTLFRTLNDLRIDAVTARGAASAEINGATYSLLASGFVHLQATAIRRIAEPPKENKDQRVFSLAGVLADMRKHRDVMTREVLVGWNGVPYDSEAAVDRWRAALPPASGSTTARALPQFGDGAWIQSRLAHDVFDRLRWGAAPHQQRQRDDLISMDCLDHLSTELGRCKNVRKFATKFIAHAAHPETRANLSPDQQRITLDGLAECTRAIVRVASFLSETILGIATVSPVPTPQFDHLAHLDKGWIPADGSQDALDRWHANVAALDAMAAEPIWPPPAPASDLRVARAEIPDVLPDLPQARTEG